jgi:hypothetical protein
MMIEMRVFEWAALSCNASLMAATVEGREDSEEAGPPRAANV